MEKCTALILLLLGSSFIAAQNCDHDAADHVQIALVELKGAENVEPNAVAELIGDLQSRVSDECRPGDDLKALGDELKERIRDGFQWFGYFKTETTDFELRELSGIGHDKRVQVTARVDLGRQYHLAHVAFTGGKVFPASELRDAIPMKDAAVFDIRLVRDGLKNLRKKYGSLGYINFTPVPNTEIDDEQKLITITFDLDEGDQFRVGRLILEGPEPYPGFYEKLKKEWAPYVGRPLDQSIWENTLERSQDPSSLTGQEAVLRSVLDLGGKFEQKLDLTHKIADFHFDFTPDGAGAEQ